MIRSGCKRKLLASSAASLRRDFGVESTPKVHRLELGHRVELAQIQAAVVVHGARRFIGHALADIVAPQFEYPVRQVLKRELDASPADVVLLDLGCEIRIEPGGEGLLVEQEFINGNWRRRGQQPVIRIVAMRQVQVFAHEVRRRVPICTDPLHGSVDGSQYRIQEGGRAGTAQRPVRKAVLRVRRA